MHRLQFGRTAAGHDVRPCREAGVARQYGGYTGLLRGDWGEKRERDLLKARGRQRTDSTHVLAAVRAALNALATVAPDWLAQHTDAEWLHRYGRRFEE